MTAPLDTVLLAFYAALRPDSAPVSAHWASSPGDSFLPGPGFALMLLLEAALH